MNGTRSKIDIVHRYEHGSVEESLNVFLDEDDSCYKTPPSGSLDSSISDFLCSTPQFGQKFASSPISIPQFLQYVKLIFWNLL